MAEHLVATRVESVPLVEHETLAPEVECVAQLSVEHVLVALVSEHVAHTPEAEYVTSETVVTTENSLDDTGVENPHCPVAPLWRRLHFE